MNLGGGRLKWKGWCELMVCVCLWVGICICILHMYAKKNIYSSFVYQEGLGAVTPSSNECI